VGWFVARSFGTGRAPSINMAAGLRRVTLAGMRRATRAMHLSSALGVSSKKAAAVSSAIHLCEVMHSLFYGDVALPDATLFCPMSISSVRFRRELQRSPAAVETPP